MLCGAQVNQARGSQTKSTGVQGNPPRESQTLSYSARENQPKYQNLIIDRGQSNEATYSNLDDYEDCTFYQSLHIPGIPVYQTLKNYQAEPLHYRNVPNSNPNTTVLPISKAKITDRDVVSPIGQPRATAHYAVHKQQSIEKCSPYAALQNTDDKKESVYEALRGPTQELYGSLSKRGRSAHC